MCHEQERALHLTGYNAGHTVLAGDLAGAFVIFGAHTDEYIGMVFADRVGVRVDGHGAIAQTVRGIDDGDLILSGAEIS